MNSRFSDRDRLPDNPTEKGEESEGSRRRLRTLQLILATLLSLAGMVLLFLGFFTPPSGEISSSVLVAFGEISTFAGALIGIDCHYRYKS